jgi:hypothetical protein
MIIKCDFIRFLASLEGEKKFKDEDLHNKVCCGLVEDAVEIFEKMSE